MKKALIVTSEFGREKGGIQNWMFYVHKLLGLHDFDIDVYAYKEDNPFRKLKQLLQSQVYLLATWEMSLFIIPSLLLKKKIVFIFIHGNDILNLNRFQSFWLNYLCGQTQIYFIANSQAVAQIFSQITKREIDLVQYPFMEISEKYPETKTHKIPVFLTISRLVKRKNIHHVLLALHKLKSEGLQFQYYIAGKGAEKETLMNLVETLSLSPEVQVLGAISEKEKAELYLSSDYFLLPSVYDRTDGSIEGYGIVFIEANAHGLPVISGNTGGMTEAVRDAVTGYQCDGTVDDIAQKIRTMLATPFDSSVLYSHAQRHYYLKQKAFLHFIDKSFHG
ncbi:MAG: hypothetical protein COB07_04970 [Sulfurovum sp.]|nr:MAG: hypothetical protein COB07_04970 [Sulfurovum sp.]